MPRGAGAGERRQGKSPQEGDVPFGLGGQKESSPAKDEEEKQSRGCSRRGGPGATARRQVALAGAKQEEGGKRGGGGGDWPIRRQRLPASGALAPSRYHHSLMDSHPLGGLP